MPDRVSLGVHRLGLGLGGVDAGLRGLEVVAVLGVGPRCEVAQRGELLFERAQALAGARGLRARGSDLIVHRGPRRAVLGSRSSSACCKTVICACACASCSSSAVTSRRLACARACATSASARTRSSSEVRSASCASSAACARVAASASALICPSSAPALPAAARARASAWSRSAIASSRSATAESRSARASSRSVRRCARSASATERRSRSLCSRRSSSAIASRRDSARRSASTSREDSADDSSPARWDPAAPPGPRRHVSGQRSAPPRGRGQAHQLPARQRQRVSRAGTDVLVRRREGGTDQTGRAGERRQLLMAVYGAVVVDDERQSARNHVRSGAPGDAQQRGARGGLHLLELHQLELHVCLGHGASHSMDVRTSRAI